MAEATALACGGEGIADMPVLRSTSWWPNKAQPLGHGLSRLTVPWLVNLLLVGAVVTRWSLLQVTSSRCSNASFSCCSSRHLCGGNRFQLPQHRSRLTNRGKYAASQQRAERATAPPQHNALEYFVNLRMLPTRRLKRELELLGIATAGCIDRESLLERLNEHSTQAMHRKTVHDEETELLWKAADAVFGLREEEEKKGSPQETPEKVKIRLEESYPSVKERRKGIHLARRRKYRGYRKANDH
mmetsp:Transcript_38198/g.75749  ORF Transcript_38198/g.75749 Transcript_38198/m.75749 type:complete len:243 (+) Transcript_38198:24-752(+)